MGLILCLRAWNNCFRLHVSSYCYQTMCMQIFHIHGKPRHSPHYKKKKCRLHWQFKTITVHTRDWFLNGIFRSVTYLKWQPLIVKINILKLIMIGMNGMTRRWYTIVEISSTRYSLFMSKVQAGTSLFKGFKTNMNLDTSLSLEKNWGQISNHPQCCYYPTHIDQIFNQTQRSEKFILWFG